ncbi:TPR-like protein [Anaeromyces robustus]|uniref:Outer dynein arm-docking complex subunit 4 n=1 Tax=Anaeromyces robustus TaxID=1754192 RepID=A0A1Y1XNI7_9FUNG|nr:TPR-like protein [Anaeromyces robustus]|eukprot:ORX87291.1 TPR-like protein [Anaeromyces robustus]
MNMDLYLKYPGIIDEDGKVISGTCFQSIAAEADTHARKGQYDKAVEFYTLALTIHNKGIEDGIKDNEGLAVPDQQANNNTSIDPSLNIDKALLVSRSECYLKLGNTEASLEDANKALKIDPTYCKAIYQKAETLYMMSDFEMALVFFHRGNQLRPELPEFSSGIHKAQEAINNSIGNPKECHIKDIKDKVKKNRQKSTPGSKKSTEVTTSITDDNNSKGSLGFINKSDTNEFLNKINGGDSLDKKNNLLDINKHKSGSPDGSSYKQSNKFTDYQLLGELYVDKQYLIDFANDKSFNTHPNEEINKIIDEGLKYLKEREDFWRQQNPLYVRKSTKITPPHFNNNNNNNNNKMLDVVTNSKLKSTKKSTKKATTTKPEHKNSTSNVSSIEKPPVINNPSQVVA